MSVRGRPGRQNTITVRINKDLLDKIKESDPLLQNIYSDSVIVDTILGIYLKYRKQIYELMLKTSV